MHKMRFYNKSFHGVINKIERDEKYFPSLYFNDEIQYLGGYFDRLCQISVGDSIVKRSGEMNYSVYWKNSSGKWILKCQSQK